MANRIQYQICNVCLYHFFSTYLPLPLDIEILDFPFFFENEKKREKTGSEKNADEMIM